MSNNNSELIPVDVVGNLGADPEVIQIPPKPKTGTKLDPITGELVHYDYLTKAREFRKFTLAINATADDKKRAGLDPDAKVDPVWVICYDWNNQWPLLRKGDFVSVKGGFKETHWTDDKNQVRTNKEIYVTEVRMMDMKAAKQS